MAQLGAVYFVGESLIRYLRGQFGLQRTNEATRPAAERVLPEATFDQISGSQMATDFNPSGNMVGLYLHRIGFDKTLRTQEDSRHPGDATSRPLSLELHYLLTVWAAEPANEQTLMVWAMRELHIRPLLDRSVLVPTRLWRAEETVQVTPSEMKHEDLMRIWDAVEPSYRLSTSYVARVVRVETDRHETAGPVVATRFQYEKHPEDVDA